MKNLGRAFSFMFEDKDWIQKILIGAAFVLLSCILIGIPLLLGYYLQLARRSAEGKELPLPDWDDLGGKFGKGLIFFIILIIYSIPLMILSFILSLIPCIGILLCLIPFIALALALPYLTVAYARSGDFNVAFEFDKMFEFIKENFTNVLIAVVMSWVLYFIAQFGALALLIGLLFTSFWAGLGTNYLYGQVWWEAENKEGPVSVETPKIEGGTDSDDRGETGSENR